MNYYDNKKIALIKKDTNICVGSLEEKYSVLSQPHSTFIAPIDDIIFDNEITIDDIIIYYTVVISGDKDYISIDYWGWNKENSEELPNDIEEIYKLLNENIASNE